VQCRRAGRLKPDRTLAVQALPPPTGRRRAGLAVGIRSPAAGLLTRLKALLLPPGWGPETTPACRQALPNPSGTRGVIPELGAIPYIIAIYPLWYGRSIKDVQGNPPLQRSLGLARSACFRNKGHTALFVLSRPLLNSSIINRDIRGQMLFLGTGTSHGVPVIGCNCPTCRSYNPRDSRTRCSVLLGMPEGNLLVDTPPELRVQLLREQIGVVHAVLYTHDHADHLFGLDDLRIFPKYLGHDLPIFCREEVEVRIRQSFSYAFDPITRAYPAGGVPRLAFQRVDTEPFEVLGGRITPLPLEHGHFDVLGYRVGDVAYCTDTNGIPPETMARLEGLDVLVLDCLRPKPHATHFHYEQAVEMARRIRARRTLFTHMSHDLGHEATTAALPPGMELAYDGLTVPLT